MPGQYVSRCSSTCPTVIVSRGSTPSPRQKEQARLRSRFGGSSEKDAVGRSPQNCTGWPGWRHLGDDHPLRKFVLEVSDSPLLLASAGCVSAACAPGVGAHSPDTTAATGDRGPCRPYRSRSCAPPDGPAHGASAGQLFHKPGTSISTRATPPPAKATWTYRTFRCLMTSAANTLRSAGLHAGTVRPRLMRRSVPASHPLRGVRPGSLGRPGDGV